MKQSLKRLMLISAVFALTLVIVPQSLTAAPPPSETSQIFMEVPDDWNSIHVWAWQDVTWATAFDAWPGGQAAPVPGNPGWYYVNVPYYMDFVIVHYYGGGDYTRSGDQTLDELPVWITVRGFEDVSMDYTPPANWADADATADTAPAEDTADEETTEDEDLYEGAAPEAETAANEDGGGLDIAVWVAIGVGALIIILLAVLLMLKKRK